MRVNSAILALGLLAGPAPSLAQNSTAPATTAPATNTTADVVGPAQLKDFSLNGTVTRRAETPAPAPAPTRAQPAPRESNATPVREASSAPRTTSPSREPVRHAEASAPAQGQTPSATAALPFDLDATPAPASSAGFSADPLAAQPASGIDTGTLAPSTEDGGWGSRLPWLLALLAALGAGAWYFRRQRSGLAFAGASGDVSAFDLGSAPPPAPERAPAPRPAPAPAPPPSAPIGIVSTRLRPWLDVEFVPEAAVIDDAQGAIQFAITVFNSGAAPARDVLVEARLFNAGPDQDQAIAAFFANPVGQGERVPVIQPLQRMSFRSAVNVPRPQMRIFEAGGRQLFVPLIGFNVLYRWSAGEGQSSMSFLVGREGNGEKLAPLRVDQGARTFTGLGARQHELGIRK